VAGQLIKSKLRASRVWRLACYETDGSRFASRERAQACHREAIYTDDQTLTKRMLEVWPVCSPHARARILRRDATTAREMAGIKAVLMADDVPGLNDVGTKHDEMLFARDDVFYHGQIVALIVGESQEACRAAADKVVIKYESLPPILTLAQAIAAASFHNEPNFIRRG